MQTLFSNASTKFPALWWHEFTAGADLFICYRPTDASETAFERPCMQAYTITIHWRNPAAKDGVPIITQSTRVITVSKHKILFITRVKEGSVFGG